MSDITNTIQETKDYNKFAFLKANRSIDHKHVKEIKKSIEDNGNFTKIQPILVNEALQVIDGQHRLVACEELGVSVFYTVEPKLTSQDALQMNILNRSWGLLDYAHHFAALGNENYQKYLTLREDYSFSHGVLLSYMEGGIRLHSYEAFRKGSFVVEDMEQSKKWLDMLTAMRPFIPQPVISRGVSLAYLVVFKSEDFDLKRMVHKLRLYGDRWQSFSRTEDIKRQIEEIYNHGQTPENRTRLF